LQSWGRPRAATRWVPRLPGSGWIRLGGICGLIAAVAWGARDSRRQAILLVDYHARRQDWPAVLAQVPGVIGRDTPAAKISVPLVAAYLDIQRALYHSGRLSDDLFSLSRPLGMPLLPDEKQGMSWCIPLSELLLELGQVNHAERWAHEALETRGERPGILRTLATVNQLLGRPQAAGVFLHRLERNPRQAAWARWRLAQLEADPAGDRDVRLQALRSVMVRSDHPGAYVDTETLLRQALEANPHNRMAYEYLMAYYLLGSRLDQAIQLMSRREEVGLTRVPRPYEEAWLLHERLRKADAAPSINLPITSAARERFRVFEERSSRFRNDRLRLRTALEADQADTFWFYYLFGETPGRKPLPALRSKANERQALEVSEGVLPEVQAHRGMSPEPE